LKNEFCQKEQQKKLYTLEITPELTQYIVRKKGGDSYTNRVVLKNKTIKKAVYEMN